MQETILAIIGGITLCFYFLGYQYDSYLSRFVSSIILIMLGLFIGATGVQYDNGANTTITVVGAVSTIVSTNTYANVEAPQIVFYSSLFGLLGMGLAWFTIRDLITENKAKGG
jgi:hypothetical protein